jgi:hypothetical protein
MMSRMTPWLLAVAFLGLAVGATMLPLSSDVVPYAFLFDRTEVKNDQQRFLYTVVEDSGASREDLQPLLPKLRPLEKQLPVALFIAKESGKPLADVVELRKAERFWLDVMNKTGVKPAVLFEGVQGKFPEPYKSAWIEYRMKFRPEFTDEQIRELVLLQIAHRVSGQPMEEIAKGVAKGKTPEIILARAAMKPGPDASPAPLKASKTAPPSAKGKAKKGGVRAR